jgi:hypothetical protein
VGATTSQSIAVLETRRQSMTPKSVKRFSDDIMLNLFDSGPGGEVGSILMQTAGGVLGSTIMRERGKP